MLFRAPFRRDDMRNLWPVPHWSARPVPSSRRSSQITPWPFLIQMANLYDASVDLKLHTDLSMNFYFGHVQGHSAIKTM